MLPALVLAAFLLPQPPPAAPPPAEPEEEDVTAKERTYEFNPIQAENEIKVGRFYMRRGRWKAAAGRFEEAARWNPQSADAFLLLGQAREKMKDLAGARAAYEKFLELAPESRDAGAVRRKIRKLPAPAPAKADTP